jgi:hypothetical protein
VQWGAVRTTIIAQNALLLHSTKIPPAGFGNTEAITQKNLALFARKR